MIVDIIKPCGFCNGVSSAIEKVKKIKDTTSYNKYYTYGSLVHNDNVIKELEEYGIHYLPSSINALSRLTKEDCVIFTAHGTNEDAKEYLDQYNISYFETSCPFVLRNKDFILSSTNPVIYVGYKNHPETDAILSLKKDIVFYDVEKGLSSTPSLKEPVVVNQTTISILDLKNIIESIINIYPDATTFKSICNVTYDRQQSVINLDCKYDLVIVVGAKYSSNTTKLYNLASSKFNAILVNDLEDLKSLSYDFKDINNIALVGGASTSINDVNMIKEYLENGKF